jgi:hypothetical protein
MTDATRQVSFQTYRSIVVGTRSFMCVATASDCPQTRFRADHISGGQFRHGSRLCPQTRFRADHISGGQFRHGSRLILWRTDKSPQDWAMDQIT